ncbi:hypothetical protein SVIOM342S_03135 [Streptomyces violaceorubidus]
MNVVCTGDGRFVEVQGTAEAEPFARDEPAAALLADLGHERSLRPEGGDPHRV